MGQYWSRLSENNPDRMKEAWDLNKKGEECFWRSDYEKAFALYTQAQEIFEEEEHEEGIAAILNNIGMVYRNKGDYENSLEYFKKALEITERRGNRSGQAVILGQIGSVLKLKGDLDSSLKYQQKALKIAEEVRDRKGKAIYLSEIGSILQENGELDSSMEYHQNALAIAEELNNVRGQAASWNLIALVYDKMKNYEKAIECEQKSLKMKEENDDIQGQAYSHFNLGYRYSNYLNDNEKGLFHLKKSVEIIEKLEVHHQKVLEAKRMIQKIETALEKEKAVTLKEVCKGTKFKDFKIIRKIGGAELKKMSSMISKSHHGVCSSVFLVELKGKHEAVLKVLHRYGSSTISKSEYEKLIEEVTEVDNEFILNPCHHFVDRFEGILEDLKIEKETVFLILPKCEMDLRHKITTTKREKKYPFETVEFLKIVKQMLSGIVALHKRMIVHRDQKSDNYLVTSRGDVRLTDFGVKKVFSPGSEFKVKFENGMCVGGAPITLPPEIMCNIKEGRELNYSKCDLFGVGLIAYSLLDERDPFSGVNPSTRDLKYYLHLDDSIDKDIRDLVKGMLHPEFEKRLNCYVAYDMCSKLCEKKLTEKNERESIEWMSVGNKKTSKMDECIFYI